MPSRCSGSAWPKQLNQGEQWLNKQLQQEGLSVDERLSLTQQAAQREAAYYQQMNAQILNETKQTSERLASVLESFFKDPMGTIKKQAEHMMAENMAAMLMQIPGVKGSFSSGFAGLFGPTAIQITLRAACIPWQTAISTPRCSQARTKREHWRSCSARAAIRRHSVCRPRNLVMQARRSALPAAYSSRLQPISVRHLQP
jgi:hypothetical protein